MRRRDADGRETYLTYDTAVRLTQQVFRTAVAGEASDAPIYFTYDQVDQLKVVDDRLSGLGVTYFDYDKVGRVTKKTALAGAVYYAYDLSGRRTSLKDPDLLESYYLYDAAGRLVREVLAAGQTAYYTYDAAGLVTRRDLPQNVVLAYLTYDVAGRLATLDQLRNGSSVQTRSFLRDANGATVRETVGGTAFNYYTYDALDRLTREIQTSTIALSLDTYYAYDAAGNRTLKGSTLAPGWVYAYTYDARNLLTIESAGGAATTYFDWDAAQRLTRQRASGDTTYYAFNQRDQVARLQNVKAAAADPTQYFSYNGVGERARVRDGDGEAYWSFDGGKLLREKAPGGGITARYRHNTSPQLDLMGSLLQAYFTPDGGGGKQTAVPRYDERGSVVALVTPAGDLPETYTYDRFGVTTGTEGKQRLRFVFGAGLLGLTAARGRYLSPWGLWLPEQGTTSGGAGRPPRYYGGSEIRMVAGVPGLWQIAGQEGPKSDPLAPPAGKPSAPETEESRVCGADLTDYVLDALDKVTSDWGLATAPERYALCSGIGLLGAFTRHAGIAWNFSLFAPDAVGRGLLGNLVEGCPVDCPDSVTFLGSCYHAQVVNYILWGHINKLCGVDVRVAKGLAFAWKAYQYGQLDGGDRFDEVMTMVELGATVRVNGAPLRENLKAHLDQWAPFRRSPEAGCRACVGPLKEPLPQPAARWSPMSLDPGCVAPRCVCQHCEAVRSARGGE